MTTALNLTADDDDLDLLDEPLVQEQDEKLRQRTMETRIGRINAKVQRYVNITFNQMGAAGASDTANLLTGLQYINAEDESDVAGWENFVRMLFNEYLPSARILYSRMQRELDRGHGAISQHDATEWEAFYRSPAHEYKHKESQILHALPREIDQSIAIRLERDELLRRAEANAVPASYALRDDAAFLSMSLSRRRTAVAALREDIRELAADMSEQHGKLRSRLLSEAGGDKAAISLDEAYRWLARTFDRCETPKDVEQFVRATIDPMLAAAAQTRADYDEVERVLDSLAAHVPASFPRRTRASFIVLSPEGRRSYVESARIVARAADSARHVEEAEVRAAAAMEQALRATLAAGDWRGAKVHLEALTALDPTHPSLSSLIDAVDDAQAEGERIEAVEESRRALATSVGTLGHRSLAKAYTAALASGTEHFETFTALVERRTPGEISAAAAAPTTVAKVKKVTKEVQKPLPVIKKMAQPASPVIDPRETEPEPADDTETDVVELEADDDTESVVEKTQRRTSVVEAKVSKRDKPGAHLAPKRPVVITAEEGEAVVKTVKTIKKAEVSEAVGLVLKADGDAISRARQAETAKIHPWLKHHLGVLQRHGAGFHDEAEAA